MPCKLLPPAAQQAGPFTAPAGRGEQAPGQGSDVLAFDHFDKELSLDWKIVRPDPSHYSLTKNPGTLTITTQQGGFYRSATTYKNLFLIECPADAGQHFQITTRISSFRALAPWNQAGLVCWEDEDNYLKWVCQQNPNLSTFTLLKETLAQPGQRACNAPPQFNSLWLRITKHEDYYTVSTSLDGDSFVRRYGCRWSKGPVKRVGIVAQDGPETSAPEVDAAFDFFEVRALTTRAPPKAQEPKKRADSGSGELPVRVFDKPGRYQKLPPPNGFEDPVTAIGREDEKRLSDGLQRLDIRPLLKGYLNRVEQCYSRRYQVPSALSQWLAGKPRIRKAFWLALSPQYDRISEAVRIFDTLREKHPEKIEKYYHLAIAVAVVWDTPDAVTSSRYCALWGHETSQFNKLPSWEEVFQYFTNPAVARYFVFRPGRLPWPFLVHLVDFDVTPEEYKWTLKNYRGKRKRLHHTYNEVKYDTNKLHGHKAAISGHPYTLKNILKYGGVCGDQAHFASRVAKCFAVPAMKVRGKGRFGTDHAWGGYLTSKGGRPGLEFTGRYRINFYYTGYVFDPQTRTMGLDRYIAMMYDGASASYRNYIDSLTLTRIAGNIMKERPQLSLDLAKKAINTNYFCRPAWKTLMGHLADGTLDMQDGVNWFNRMLRKLRHHPDLTIEFLDTLMTRLPEDDIGRRQRAYNRAFALYGNRPDLQIRLRIDQCRELYEAGKAVKALRLALETCRANAGEGALILPLVRQGAKIAKEQNLSEKALPRLRKIAKNFPKDRVFGVSKAYVELKEIVESLQ